VKNQQTYAHKHIIGLKGILKMKLYEKFDFETCNLKEKKKKFTEIA
jgi:hypothetical protein